MPPSGSIDMEAKTSLALSVFSQALTTPLTFSITSAGVPVGAIRAYHADASKRATPVSVTVGTSGSRALRLAPVSVVAPFDYSQILWAVLLGWTIWGTAPDWATLAGAALIAASGLYTAFREHRLRIKAAPPVPVE